jgi:nucleoside-diphosphate-sugar epimerase
MSDGARRLFCFGLGFSAARLAVDLRAQGWRIAGTCRGAETAEAIAETGIEMFRFDGTAAMADAEAALAGTTHLLISVPPGPAGDPVLTWHREDILRLTGLDWVGYLSTTGVYGNRDGDWVDEESERRPSSERGLRRVAAEDGWLDLWRRHGLPVHLFRLAGIYGPGRNALETVRSGRAKRIRKPGQVFSRIHVDDIAAVLAASIDRPDPGRAYNLCDDEAAPPDEVIAFACDLLGRKPPPEEAFETADMSEMARSFYADNKRVSNARIKDELGVQLRWPNYRDGLRGILAAE